MTNLSPRQWLCHAVLCIDFLLLSLCVDAAELRAEQINVDSVTVTADPSGSAQNEFGDSTTVLNGRNLSSKLESTLGATLTSTPGVHSSSFGPNASRPVIRGLDGDRIKLLQNGVGVVDASSLSQDHVVPVEPLIIDQLEVVRGTAALQYGGSAVGGVVNAVDNRIPKEAVDGITGRGEVKLGGADRQKSGVALLEAGNGRFAVHADAYKRETDDLEIPGFARSARLRAIDPQVGEAINRLPNSAAKSDGGALGASFTFDNGYAGLAYSAFNSTYGTVAEPNVVIDAKSTRADFAAEVNELASFITGVKFKLSRTDYEHQELDLGVVGTSFTNQGWDALLEVKHHVANQSSSVIGLQLHRSTFGATGEEALVPTVKTDSDAIYVLEELPWMLDGHLLKVSLGGRLENTQVESAGGGPDIPNVLPATPRFGVPSSTNFKPVSVSLSGVYQLNTAWDIVTNLTHTERAPAYYELYTNGPHVATGQYEIGNADLGIERANGLDVQLRWRQGTDRISLTGFYTRFQNYITFFNTGNQRGSDGELSPVDVDRDGVADFSGAEILPESIYQSVPAVFKGVEVEGKFRLYEDHGDLDLDVKGDYVRATNVETGESLPRISPLRLGAGLEYRINRLNVRMDVIHTFRQNRVAANELPTDGYTLVNADLNYEFSSAPHVSGFIKATNLLNEDAREHTSILKDIAPLGGRSVLIGLRGDF